METTEWIPTMWCVPPQMVVFVVLFCCSIFLMFHVTVGLDQELAMPQVGRTTFIGSVHQKLSVGLLVSRCV